MEFPEQEQKISKYNAAIAQLYRLDNLWQRCHLFRSQGMLNKWNERLDCIWTELGSDSNKQDEKEFNKFVKLIVKNKKNRGILNQILIRKEIWLRKLQNKQGKGTAYVEGSVDDYE